MNRATSRRSYLTAAGGTAIGLAAISGVYLRTFSSENRPVTKELRIIPSASGVEDGWGSYTLSATEPIEVREADGLPSDVGTEIESRFTKGRDVFRTTGRITEYSSRTSTNLYIKYPEGDEEMPRTRMISISGTGEYFISTSGDEPVLKTTTIHAEERAETKTDPGKSYAIGRVTGSTHTYAISGPLTALWPEPDSWDDRLTYELDSPESSL